MATDKASDAQRTSDNVTNMWHFRSGKHFRRMLEGHFDAHLADIADRQIDSIDQLPYARWLLDNSHIVREALQQIQTDLPAHYYRQLVQSTAPDSREQPRIFALVDQAIEDHGLPIDNDAIEAGIRALTIYDGNPTGPPLTLGELWAVPIALRILLILRLCRTLSLSREDCLDAGSEDEVEHKTTIVADCIISLRTVATTNWRKFVERISTVEQHLRDDPEDVYRRMDFETRDHYRGIVDSATGNTKR